MIDYIIPKKYRDKDVELPAHKTLDDVCNDRVILHVPKNAFYLCIQPVEPNPWERDSDDDLYMNPVLQYINEEKRLIDIQDLSGFDMFSLDRRLELIFENYS